MLAHLGEQAVLSEDHNATSYSTETRGRSAASRASVLAKIITLRAIALKLSAFPRRTRRAHREDHNATSYSTETNSSNISLREQTSEDHNATSYSTETLA